VTEIGAILWLAMRILYLPIYALGIPKIRTIIFIASVLGILMILRPVLLP
jgi:uncharacterized MAPEG superfamily protein